MDTIPDYLNPYRIYMALRIDVPPGFDSIRVGVSDLEKTTPTVKDFLTTAGDCSGDEVVYSTPICSGKCCQTAPVRENLTTAESAEKCRVGQPGYPTANGRQVKNGTGIEEIERGTLDLQVGTAEPGTETVPNCGTETRQSAECAWCGPGRIGWFSVLFWVRSCYGKRKWMSVTQQYKHQVRYCPMCGKKVEGSK
jgi:hypothetical protein